MKVCFVGPRPKELALYNTKGYVALAQELVNLCVGFEKGTEFISDGAQGFPQVAYFVIKTIKEARQDLMFKNVVYIPYKGMEKRWLKEGLFGRGDYRTMLESADEVIYLNDTVNTKNDVTEAFYSCCYKMVDDSDTVIALYKDNSWEQCTGSNTAECMRYAKQQHKRIIQFTYKIVDNEVVIKKKYDKTY